MHILLFVLPGAVLVGFDHSVMNAGKRKPKSAHGFLMSAKYWKIVEMSEDIVLKVHVKS